MTSLPFVTFMLTRLPLSHLSPPFTSVLYMLGYFPHNLPLNAGAGQCYAAHVNNTVCTYGAVRDPLLVAVLLRSPEFPGQLGAVDVGVQLSY